MPMYNSWNFQLISLLDLGWVIFIMGTIRHSAFYHLRFIVYGICEMFSNIVEKFWVQTVLLVLQSKSHYILIYITSRLYPRSQPRLHPCALEELDHSLTLQTTAFPVTKFKFYFVTFFHLLIFLLKSRQLMSHFVSSARFNNLCFFYI